MGAGAGVVPTPAYPTAYPVAATPPPVVPSYDYNVAAYGPMGAVGVNAGVAAAVGGNPYAASPDPYLSSDPNGPYNAAAAAAYFANVPTHTAHAQIRAMGYADPVSTMQYWQQCLDYFSRSAAMSGYQPYAPAPAAPGSWIEIVHAARSKRIKNIFELAGACFIPRPEECKFSRYLVLQGAGLGRLAPGRQSFADSRGPGGLLEQGRRLAPRSASSRRGHGAGSALIEEQRRPNALPALRGD